ncbi:hypothetical protein, conserved [Leishmania tarentolae]|uniref:Uncharacterized protein n=1 Tax=Leishmania tarentolae TaxID=5689 RepID=A0A640KKT6_LEITA|nr:hypothetical protein, conserved [Leishmania tarentolae]
MPSLSSALLPFFFPSPWAGNVSCLPFPSSAALFFGSALTLSLRWRMRRLSCAVLFSAAQRAHLPYNWACLGCSEILSTALARTTLARATQQRWVSTSHTGLGATGQPTHHPLSPSPGRRDPFLGVVQITSKNIKTEMESKVPLFLYFMVTNHPEVKQYTELLCHQVDQANRRVKDENFGDVYQEFGKDSGLAIKLGIVDCLQEPGLMAKFHIDPHMFPLIYFVRNKVYCDKMAGVVTESHVKEAVEAFIDYAKLESKNESEGISVFQKVRRQDNDDENAMTLIAAAHGKMQAGDPAKGKLLFEKALRISMEDIEVVKKRYGVPNKKMTPELWAKLKREPCYNSAPEALCGLAMCAMASKQRSEAFHLAARVREEFPFAPQDMRSVAEAVVRIELIQLVDYDPDTDNYMRLLKFDELVSEPAQFYKHHLKRAVAFYVEGVAGQAIEECLRLIRAEPKLLSALKESGIVPKDLRLGPTAATPARQVIRAIFEALGSTNEHVEKGRKLLQLYI